MYLWGGFPFLRYTLALIGGIVLVDQVPELLPQSEAIQICALLFLVIVLIIFLRRKAYQTLLGFLSCFLLFVVGGLITHIHLQTNNPDHYTHLNGIQSTKVVLISDATERKDYYRYDAELLEALVDSQMVQSIGKIHVYIRKTDTTPVLHYGDHLLIKGGILPIQAPKNPHEFDYKRYLVTQNIYGHAFLSPNDLLVLGNDPPSRIMEFGLLVRGRAMEIIKLSIPEPREQAIMEALVLGVKDHLDNEIKEAYSAAGAMHVLAVSGLHVGIVFIMLGSLLGFMKKTKQGKIAFMIIALLCIWAYALVTGFSASVLRAVIMFSVILISGNLGRQAYTYNSLGIAAFILLLYDPFLIYSVGFQLSFIAVFGIVYLHPRLHRLWEAPNKAIDYVWSITCVSIAAQIATFPLTTLYFHQFPTYFLVSNLVVIPASFAILIGGVAMLILGSIWSFFGLYIGTIVFYMVWAVNECLLFLTHLPYPIFDWLYFDLKDTLLIYLFMIFMTVAFNIRGRAPFIAGVITLTFWAGWVALDNRKQLSRKEVVVYELKDHTAFDLISGKESLLLIDTLAEEEKELIGFQINPNRLANGLQPVESTIDLISNSQYSKSIPGGSLIAWNGFKILVLDKKSKLNADQLATADLVLVNDPYVEDIPDVPVVIGTQMKFYQQKKLKNTLTHSHSLSLDGYYRVSL